MFRKILHEKAILKNNKIVQILVAVLTYVPFLKPYVSLSSTAAFTFPS